MKRTMTSLLAIAAMALAACSGSGQKAVGSGDVKFGVSIAALKGDVNSVTLTVTDVNDQVVRTVALAKEPNGDWSAMIQNLPVALLTFTANAYKDATLLYTGTATATPVANSTISILIYLNETAQTPFSNDAPTVISLVASADTIAPGARLDLTATAQDLDADPIQFTWTDTVSDPQPLRTRRIDGGTAAAAGVSDRLTWTAPQIGGLYAITLTLTDGRGAQTVVTFTIDVTTTATPANIAVVAVLNDAPRVSLVTVLPTNAPTSTRFSIDASVSDAETPVTALLYAWSIVATPDVVISPTQTIPGEPACTGDITGATTRSPTFSTTEAAGRRCTLHLAVADGVGGSNAATVTFLIGQPAATYDGGTAPTFVGADMSNPGPNQGDAVTFSVSFASITPVTLDWSTNFDTKTQSTAFSPTGEFTDSFAVGAMACGPAGAPAQVFARLTQGASTQTYTFSIALPGCP